MSLPTLNKGQSLPYRQLQGTVLCLCDIKFVTRYDLIMRFMRFFVTHAQTVDILGPTFLLPAPMSKYTQDIALAAADKREVLAMHTQISHGALFDHVQ